MFCPQTKSFTCDGNIFSFSISFLDRNSEGETGSGENKNRPIQFPSETFLLCMWKRFLSLPFDILVINFLYMLKIFSRSQSQKRKFDNGIKDFSKIVPMDSSRSKSVYMFTPEMTQIHFSFHTKHLSNFRVSSKSTNSSFHKAIRANLLRWCLEFSMKTMWVYSV